MESIRSVDNPMLELGIELCFRLNFVPFCGFGRYAVGVFQVHLAEVVSISMAEMTSEIRGRTV